MKHRGKTKVAVLAGGPSSEHDVSLKSADNVLAHLDPERFDAMKIVVDRKGTWKKDPIQLKRQFDVAFIAMHGTYGEDGTVQSMLDHVELPYTGSAALPSALAMNKFLSLRLFGDAGLRVPFSYLVNKKAWTRDRKNILKDIGYYFSYPIVVKPNNEGSSVRVSFVHTVGELEESLQKIFLISEHALLQPYITGREVTCGVLDYGWSGSAFPLMPTEIIPQVSHFFDYRAKYEPGGSLEITPARFSPAMLRDIQRTAVSAHKLVGARGISRTDMILDPQGQIHVLEINTIPGFTKESLTPKAAEASGISFSKLLEILIHGAFRP